MKSNEGMENFMLNGVTMKINIDEYILNALKEDITSEDVTTNAIKTLMTVIEMFCFRFPANPFNPSKKCTFPFVDSNGK